MANGDDEWDTTGWDTGSLTDPGGMNLFSSTSAPDFSISNPTSPGGDVPFDQTGWGSPIPGTGAAPGAPGAPQDVNPNLYNDPNATVPSAKPGSGVPDVPVVGGGGKPVTQKLADALGKLSAATAVKSNPAPVQANLGLRAQGPQSSAFRGQSTLSNLVQLLMQRQQQYGPPGTSSGGGRGLLGV
jgi:hypothetical protein